MKSQTNLVELELSDLENVVGGGFNWRKAAIFTAISPLAGAGYTSGYLYKKYLD